MKLTQIFAAVMFATSMIGIIVEAKGVTLSVDKVKQRYPWNGLVDIDYSIQWGDGEAPDIEDNLEVLMIDKSVSPAETNVATCFLQAPLPMTNGQHRITWDANYDGVKVNTDHAEFIVKIVHYGEAYMVIDVSTGSGVDAIYKVDFLNGIPVGGFNISEYKCDKIVLRRIHPGSYVAGSPADEANRTATAARERQHRVAISKPFYIGIFQITQKQYVNVMGKYVFKYSGDERPADQMAYELVRGGNWPTTVAPGANTFMGNLLAKCRARNANGDYDDMVTGFDLPTEFEWEYACRAGTMKAYNVTNDFNNADSNEQYAQLAKVGRYKNNGGLSGKHAVVGSYQPNAWGLYDMHGNVYEWCRDWYVEDAASLKQYVDPIGPDTGTYRMLRGGNFLEEADCRSAARASYYPQSNYRIETFGFRLARIVP